MSEQLIAAPRMSACPDLAPQLLEQLQQESVRHSVPAGTHLYWEGDSCGGVAVLLTGSIRVYRCSREGREITLYEINSGDTCILNVSCVLSGKKYPANAVSLSHVDLLVIPAERFIGLFSRLEPLRSMVFTLLSERLGAIMELVDEVAFRRMDERLMEYLQAKEADGLLQTTHQKIASDLGTSREVVSRILKDFERQGKLQLMRNEIRLLAVS